MTYWALNAVFLGAVAVLAIIVIVLRRAPAWGAAALAAGALLVFTAVFDNIMIGVGLVGYNASLTSGIVVGIAPLEDFAYPLAAGVLLPSLWMLVSRRDRR